MEDSSLSLHTHRETHKHQAETIGHTVRSWSSIRQEESFLLEPVILLASRTVVKKVLLFKPPSLEYFIIACKTKINTNFLLKCQYLFLANQISPHFVMAKQLIIWNGKAIVTPVFRYRQYSNPHKMEAVKLRMSGYLLHAETNWDK